MRNKGNHIRRRIVRGGVAALIAVGLLWGAALPDRAQADPISDSDRAKIGEIVHLPAELPEIRKDGKAAALPLAKMGQGKILALFCFSEQCGVTYYYKQRLRQIVEDFKAQGVVFVGVRCGKREKPDEPLQLAEANYLTMPFADDAAGDLVRYFGVRQSLTFEVVDREGRLRYRGAFDDNADEKKVKTKYLRNALNQVIAGRPVTATQGKALGCAILPIK